MILIQMILAQPAPAQIEPVFSLQDVLRTASNSSITRRRNRLRESLAFRRYPAEIRSTLVVQPCSAAADIYQFVETSEATATWNSCRKPDDRNRATESRRLAGGCAKLYAPNPCKDIRSMRDDATAPWLQLTLEAIEHHPEQLEDALLQAGALAVTLEDAGDQPVLEPAPGETPLWAHTRVTGLFDAQTDIEVVKGQLRRFLHAPILPECRLTALEERDWVRAWMDNFHPMRFGRRLWICPTHRDPPEPAAINVRLDPGLAFGTGTHPTTALCLDWLDGADLADQTVLDYGCGSGVLAIAAAKLGARRVWAVDIDPQALLASDDNASENEVEDRIELSAPAELPAGLQVDILLANILAGVLVRLAPEFGQRVKPGGRLVLSGILEQHADAVQAAFARDFAFAPPRRREDWVLLEGMRR